MKAICVIHVCESPAVRVLENAEACVLGEHARIDVARLGAFLSRRLEAVDADLLNLLAAVRYGDRLLVRKQSEPWGREMHVLMPVSDPARWADPLVHDALAACLLCLTGDWWRFTFRAREIEDPLMIQFDLFGQLRRGGVVVPYSGGLDSYAALELLLDGTEPAAPRPILLTAGINPQVSALLDDTVGGGDCHRLLMPIGSNKVRNGESSGRPRSFVFFALAALAARMAMADAVVVPENGQGTFGPALVPFGREHPLMTSHPRFTRLLRAFLTALWGSPAPSFRHPWAFHTKGEMLVAVRARGRGDAWSRTRSCGRPTQRAKGKGAPAHCGTCANCILRRQALHAAGLSPFADPIEAYLWSFNAEDIETGLLPGMRAMTRIDRGYAVNGVMNLQALAEVRVEAFDPAIERKVEDVAWGLDISRDAARTGMARLVAKHNAEWTACLASLPTDAWLRREARGGC